MARFFAGSAPELRGGAAWISSWSWWLLSNAPICPGAKPTSPCATSFLMQAHSMCASQGLCLRGLWQPGLCERTPAAAEEARIGLFLDWLRRLLAHMPTARGWRRNGKGASRSRVAAAPCWSWTGGLMPASRASPAWPATRIWPCNG
jgi:hypothetical protein